MRIISRGTVDEPKRIFCDSCGSELEYTKEDMVRGTRFCYVTCPVCGRDVHLDSSREEEVHIPEYPVNGYDDFSFFKYGVDVADEDINRWINETCTMYRDASEDERKRFRRTYSTGNAIMIAIGYEDPDEPLVIYVSKDYAEANYYIDR